MSNQVPEENIEPSLTDKIQSALKEDGKFCYQEGMSFERHAGSRMTNKYEFQELGYKYDDNQTEKIEHAFIIAAILKLGIATKQMILDYLMWDKKCNPSKHIPLCGSNPETNKKRLKNILERLCKYGLVYSKDYVATNGTEKIVVVVYYGTMYGHTFYRNVLEEFMEFDMNSVFRADVATFRMLAVNEVLYKFGHYDETTGLFVNGRYGIGGPYKKLKHHIYGMATLGEGANKQILILEPVFLRYNPQVLTQEKVEEHIGDRFDSILRVIKQLREKEGNTVMRMVYIVENMDGLRWLRQHIGEELESDLFKDALFTSENVVYRQGGDLDKSFMKLVVSEKTGKLQFRPAKESWKEYPA